MYLADAEEDNCGLSWLTDSLLLPASSEASLSESFIIRSSKHISITTTTTTTLLLDFHLWRSHRVDVLLCCDEEPLLFWTCFWLSASKAKQVKPTIALFVPPFKALLCWCSSHKRCKFSSATNIGLRKPAKLHRLS